MTHFKNEKDFTNSVRKAARQLGWLEYHTYSSLKSAFGFPDLVLAKPGQMVIFAELKMPKGRMSRYQEEWEKVLRASAGCQYYLWRPDDWDTIIEILTNGNLSSLDAYTQI